MSGNFDYPPASNNRPLDINSIPARFHNIRQTLQRERERDRLSWDHAAGERSREYRDMPPVTRSASHRRMSGPRGAPPPFRNGRRVTNANDVPSSLGRRPRPPAREAYPMSRARRGLTTREQYANLHPHLERHPSSTSERLEHINSGLNELLDPSSFRRSSPFPNLESYLANGTLEDYDEDESRQRLKRRKLDHHDSRQYCARIEYGHFGQVVAGPLKMEIVSCDGGQLRDHNPSLHRPENVLRTDKSVYCTERPQCNLLLRHQGETTFSLEKLIIKGPDKGFTAPVQEGLVFVSMSSHGLTSSASQYAIRYSQPPRSGSPRQRNRTPERRRGSGNDRGLTLLEAINDQETWDTYQRSRDRSNSSDGGVPTTPRYQDENEDSWRHRSQSDNHDGWATADQLLSGRFDHPNHPILEPQLSPQDFRAPTPPPPPQICITTDADDTSIPEQEEEATAAEILADRVVREARWHSSVFHEDFDAATNGDDLLPPLERMWRDTRDETYGRRPPPPGRDRWNRRPPSAGSYPYLSSHRRSRPSKIELAYGRNGGVSNGPGGKAVEPTASFFIPEDKSAIAVKFDPPICGRWICVRMFSPSVGGNIDVQSIVAYGFAGQRYFPVCAPV